MSVFHAGIHPSDSEPARLGGKVRGTCYCKTGRTGLFWSVGSTRPEGLVVLELNSWSYSHRTPLRCHCDHNATVIKHRAFESSDTTCRDERVTFLCMGSRPSCSVKTRGSW